jgi:hypothetical protein
MHSLLYAAIAFGVAGPIVALLAIWWLARGITNPDDYGPLIGVLLCTGFEVVAVILLLVGLAVKVL